MITASEKFDPRSKTFSPDRLHMSLEAILLAVNAYRAGGDWQKYLPPSQGGNYVEKVGNDIWAKSKPR